MIYNFDEEVWYCAYGDGFVQRQYEGAGFSSCVDALDFGYFCGPVSIREGLKDYPDFASALADSDL